jgi:hypothetical protein
MRHSAEEPQPNRRISIDSDLQIACATLIFIEVVLRQLLVLRRKIGGARPFDRRICGDSLHLANPKLSRTNGGLTNAGDEKLDAAPLHDLPKRLDRLFICGGRTIESLDAT